MRTIPGLIRAAVEDVPDKPWLLYEGSELTYAAMLERVQRARGWLRDKGVAAGDRVIVIARNHPDTLLVWFALMELGAIEVPLNPALTDVERQGFVEQVRPALVLDDLAGVFDADADASGQVDRDERDIAVMIPTSGTTGRSKLVMQTHLAYVMAAEGYPWWLELTSDDRLLTTLPLFHINAPAYSTLGSIAARASLALLPAFHASTFLDSARAVGATQFNSIGAMLEILMRQPERDDDADNPIRLCYPGPAPAEARHVEIEARFGWRITCGYALSETPYGLVWLPGTRPYGTLGAPRQHPTLGHVNDARVNDDGELELHNPAIMHGYFEMPEETAAVITDDRWLRTGDLVTANEDGTYTFVGRKKEVIRRRGENLSPTEVQDALERHPTVAEAAVIGVPSDMSEEEVKAFVVAASGATVDVDALHAFAHEHLSRFKVPRYYEVVDELPHTPTGRLAKHQLPADRNEREVDMGQARGR